MVKASDDEPHDALSQFLGVFRAHGISKGVLAKNGLAGERLAAYLINAGVPASVHGVGFNFAEDASVDGWIG